MFRGKIWKTRLEKMEEIVSDWIGFRDDYYEDEGDFLHAMDKQQRRKKDMKVVQEEWNAVWMLKQAQKRGGMIVVQYNALRDVMKTEGDRIMEFVDKNKKQAQGTLRANSKFGLCHTP